MTEKQVIPGIFEVPHIDVLEPAIATLAHEDIDTRRYKILEDIT